MTQPGKNPKKNPLPSSQDEQISNLQGRHARALADYQNLEKRFAKESGSIIKFANANLLGKLLSVRDYLASASTHFQDPSLTMILGELDKILAEEGVENIDTTGHFDPATMECAEVAPGDKNQVVSVQRVGYRLGDRVLRSARVVVGNGASDVAIKDK